MRRLKVHKGFRLHTDRDTVVVVCGVTVLIVKGNWSGRWDKVTCKRCLTQYEPETIKKH